MIEMAKWKRKTETNRVRTEREAVKKRSLEEKKRLNGERERENKRKSAGRNAEGMSWCCVLFNCPAVIMT